MATDNSTAAGNSRGSFFRHLFSIIALLLFLFYVGTLAYSLYNTRSDSFSGVWIVRTNIVLLLVILVSVMLYGAVWHKHTVGDIPSCLSVQYVKFRWYVWLMALASFASIAIYFTLVQRGDGVVPRLLLLLRAQIQTSLFVVAVIVVSDALGRFFHRRQLSVNEQSAPILAPRSPTPQQPQFGYFSPKSKSNTPTLTSHKSPFDSGKFRYAR